MVYVVIPYTPDGPVTKAVKKTLKKSNQHYKLGYLGELMDENYDAAIKHQHYLYEAEHLKKLKHVEANPQVVDIAFDIMEEMLNEKGIEIPTYNEGRTPYYPNYVAILGYALLIAMMMTFAIIFIVLTFQDAVALMTILITTVSIVGALAFVYALANCVTYVTSPATGLH